MVTINQELEREGTLMLLIIYSQIHFLRGFSEGTMIKNLPANAGDARDAVSVPGSGRSPEEGNGKSTPVFLPGKFY